MHADRDYRSASRRVRKKISFWCHCIVYVMVNSLLFTINILNDNKLWFYYPLLGWLIGLFIHAMITYCQWPDSLRNKMFQRELKLIKRNNEKR
ncbi:2TM domain-containing protein [Pantoea ananatis]